MNLLIVDDEKIAVDAIVATAPFEKYGIDSVFTANCMQQAIEILGREKVDILLCDIEMPNGSGLDLIKWVNENRPRVVKLILSCHNEFEFAQQAVGLSCLLYILKPATPDTMDRALAKASAMVLKSAADDRMMQFGEAYARKMVGIGDSEQTVVEKVNAYIREHITLDLSVDELAARAYVSPNHLTRCFKKQYGKTVTEYIIDYRMGLAEKLLKDTNLTVTAVSAKVGYANYAYFTRQFKKYSGYTPSQYRELLKQEE